jgi:Fe-S cluster assembly protein SufD
VASPSATAPGSVIEIAPGTTAERILDYDVASDVPHTVIHVGDGARVTIVERLHGASAVPVAASTEIVAGERSSVSYTVLETLPTGTAVTSRRTSRAAAGAQVAWNVALLGGGTMSEEIVVEQDGPGVGSEIAAVFFPVGRENVQLTTEVRHNVPNTASQTVVRSIAAGRGRGRYFGNIRIAPHAHGSEASLRDDTLLIGKDARIEAIPALEIAANDVKAFHGATVGAIDEEHIFYLMSRGIERDAAEKLIALGFFEPAIARFPGENLRAEVRTLLEEKLAGARR